MRTKHWLLTTLLLALSLFAAPRAQAQDTTIALIDDVFTIANATISDSIPTGKQVDPVLQCLANPSIDSASCAADNGLDDEQAGWVSDLYAAFSSGNFDSIVSAVFEFAKENAPCIVLDVLTGGAGGQLCDLAKEVIAILGDIGGAIVEFLADLGEAVAGAIDDIGCALGLGGCSSSSPPDQIAYAFIYAPDIGNGAQELEFGMNVKYGYQSVSCTNPSYDQLLSTLRWNASQSPAILNIQLPPGFNFMTFPGWAIDNAERMFRGASAAQWNADMVNPSGGWLWKLDAERVKYYNDTDLLFLYEGAALGQNPKRPGDWILAQCEQDFASMAYGQVDCWLNDAFNVYEQYVPPEDRDAVQQIRGKTQSNPNWCANTYLYKHAPTELGPYYRNYLKATICPESNGRLVCNSKDNFNRCTSIFESVDSDNSHICRMAQPSCPIKDSKFVCNQQQYQYCLDWAQANQADGAHIAQCTLDPPPCAQYDGAYYCKSMDDYTYCRNWASSVQLNSANFCKIDTSVLGPQEAQQVLTYLGTLHTMHQCTVNGVMLNHLASVNAITPVNGANLHILSPALSNQHPGTTQAATPAAPDTAPTAVACPRMGIAHACLKEAESLQQALGLPLSQVKLVDCQFDPDPDYAKQMQEVAAALSKIESQLGYSANYSNIGIADLDPLVVWAQNYDLYNKLTKMTARVNYFSHPPSSQTTFVDQTSLTETLDGVSTPTLFFDLAALTQQIIHDADAKRITTLMPGQGIIINPITQGQNLGQTNISPVAQLNHGIVQSNVAQSIATQGITPQMTGTSTQQVRDDQVRTPRSNFDLLADTFGKVRPVPATAPACNCAALLNQIYTLDKQIAALIQQGRQLAAQYDAAPGDPAKQQQLTKQFMQINPQIFNDLNQRAKLYQQFSAQQNSNMVR